MARILIGLATVAGLVYFNAAWGRDFGIVLDRPLHRGATHRLSGESEESLRRSVVFQGRTLQDEKMESSLVFDSVYTVVEVDSDGHVSEAQVEFRKLQRIEGNWKEDLLRPGTVVQATDIGEAKGFVVDGSEVDPVLGKHLSTVIPIGRPDVTILEMFLPQGRKKVGDTWPVNADAVARALKRLSVEIKPSDLQGQVRLDAVRQVQGRECLALRIKIFLNRVSPLLEDMPEVNVQRSSGAIRANLLLPVEPSLPALEESFGMNFDLTAYGRRSSGEPPLTVRVSASRKVNLHREDFADTPQSNAPAKKAASP